MIQYALLRLAQINIGEDELEIPRAQANSDAFATALELAFGLLGAVAVIVIVVAGIRFILSRGNSDAVAKARNTIIYAAIGIVISMLSFAIVRFVVRSL